MEILDDDHGVLVGFHDSQAMAQAINALLSDDGERSALAARAYARGRTMIWTKMAERAAGLLAEVQTTRPARLPSVQRLANLEPDLSSVLRLTDATGMLQPNISSIPTPRPGYSLDEHPPTDSL